MALEPFTVNVRQDILDDLRDRLAHTRWPDEVRGAGWDYGTNLVYMEELIGYWKDQFDWRSQERAMNRFHHYRAGISGFGIHLIREPGKGKDPLPLLLLHGWPACFLQMLPVIPLLADPAGHGGDAPDSFEVIVPDLPGFGFSDRPAETGMSIARIADLLFHLMRDELGYRRFAVRGSDIGAGVAVQLALVHPDSVIGIHLSGTNPFIPFVPPDLSPAEEQFVRDAENWRNTEFGYALEQSTKPQTLAFGLTDSPAGLAAWIIEKFRAWSDCGGDLESRFSKDELLANLTVYWATGTIASSVRLYYESAHDREAAWGRVSVPTAMAMLPKDMFPTPREWATRWSNVQRWTELPRGGHFGEMEEPDLLATDIRAFFRTLR